jgi:hypothetical protein
MAISNAPLRACRRGRAEGQPLPTIIGGRDAVLERHGYRRRARSAHCVAPAAGCVPARGSRGRRCRSAELRARRAGRCFRRDSRQGWASIRRGDLAFEIAAELARHIRRRHSGRRVPPAGQGFDQFILGARDRRRCESKFSRCTGATLVTTPDSGSAMRAPGPQSHRRATSPSRPRRGRIPAPGVSSRAEGQSDC